jgi:hypothetical protein
VAAKVEKYTKTAKANCPFDAILQQLKRKMPGTPLVLP